MLLIKVNNVDISRYYVAKSFSKTEQNNNRAHTAKMTVVDYRVIENQTVDIRDYTTLKIPATGDMLYPEEMFEDSNKFIVWQKITIGDGGRDDYECEIAEVGTDYLRITNTLPTTIPQGEKVKIKVFGWILTTVDEEQFGKVCGWYEYSVSMTDYKVFLDRENVQDSFLNMYSRELFGRILYFFCARDSSLVINDMQTPGTASGVALSMVNESTDRIQGTNCQKTGTNNGGTAIWTIATGGTLDLSGYTHLRRWRKSQAWSGTIIQSLKMRLVTATGNADYPINRIGTAYEDCRNRESVRLNSDAITTGYDLEQVTSVQIIMDVTSPLPSGSLLFDIIEATTGGFTLTKAVRWMRKFEDVRIQHRKPSEVIEDLCKIQGEYRHVDYDRDLMYYTKLWHSQAPFFLSPSTANYGSLSISVDTTDLKNRQTVVGGEAVEEVLYIQDEISDGEEESYRLDHKAKDLAIFVSTDGGTTFVPKTVGIENLVDGTSVDFLHNFQEKIVKLGSHPKLSAGHILRREYYPYKPVSYRFGDNNSILAMQAITGGSGVYDGALIIDRTIDSQQEAYLRAKAEVDLYKNPIVTCDFVTNYDNLAAWQLIRITDPNRQIDDDFLIQKISSKEKASGYREYKVTASSSMFGIIEFFQLLLKKTARLYLNEDAIIYIVTNVDEVIRISDQYQLTVYPVDCYAGDKIKKVRDFTAESGSRSSTGAIIPRGNQWDMLLSWWETGSVSFSHSTNHNNGKSMKLTTTVGWSWKSLKASTRYAKPMTANAPYTFGVRHQQNTLPTNTATGYGASVIVREYNSAWSLVASNTIALSTNVHDFSYKNLQFVSSGTTVSYAIEVVVQACATALEIADITLEQTNGRTVEWVQASYCEAT